VACEDTSHQAINQLIDAAGTRTYEVIKEECVGCNLCEITCPVQGCITMVPQTTASRHELDAGSRELDARRRRHRARSGCGQSKQRRVFAVS
jgi:NAD-dependent dihydropyrimidine dehydrogenase PreA subunit